jgi:hypothetical protein
MVTILTGIKKVYIMVILKNMYGNIPELGERERGQNFTEFNFNFPLHCTSFRQDERMMGFLCSAKL